MPGRPSHLKRAALLLACIGVGLGIALIGTSLSGNDLWYLAIPAAIAAGWLFVADPTQCNPPP
jgi:hypothetical protein